MIFSWFTVGVANDKRLGKQARNLAQVEAMDCAQCLALNDVNVRSQLIANLESLFCTNLAHIVCCFHHTYESEDFHK